MVQYHLLRLHPLNCDEIWIYNHHNVINSHFTNEHVNIKDNTTGEVMKTENLVIQILDPRGIHSASTRSHNLTD